MDFSASETRDSYTNFFLMFLFRSFSSFFHLTPFSKYSFTTDLFLD